MRRCTIFRGSNTWRGLNASTREEPAKCKLRGGSPWKLIWEINGHEGTHRPGPRYLTTGRQRHSSVYTADSPVKTFHRETEAEESPSDNAIQPTESDAQPIPNFPLSPLMDPEFQQAKQRHSHTKLPSTKLDTQLQKELAKNPFALALASPIRTCGLSNVALPRYFLQDFKVLSHPTTDVPYFVPTSLTRKHARAKTASSHKPESALGLTAYTLANNRTLSMMQDPRSGYFKGRGGASQRAHHKLIPRWFFEIKPIMKELMASRWRPDMEQFVLELLRRRCVERLVELVNSKRGYLVGCADWEDATRKPSVAAFLWTGGKETDPRDPPADFCTLDLGMDGGLKGGEKKRKRKVPVYNLRTLLGSDKLAELGRQLPTGIFTRDVIAVKHKNMTVDLQMHLWKMEGYIANFDKILKVRSDLEGSSLEGRRSTLDMEEEEDDYDEEEEEDEDTD